uniref:NADH dehydrogenase subunit 4L n=1 Tax=Megaspilidae sp. ZJUH_2016022 TaxID=2491163 RepID=A0A3Q8UA65_9HYME|nr:NADH dehydrogenase subunit 4L [Megaspilidae sp. ZJUH_2016022]
MEFFKFIMFAYLTCLFYSFYKHLLIMLMGLEVLMLGLLMVLLNNYMLLMLNIWVLMYFMIFMVCDAVLGLTLMVLIIRFYSNDYLMSLNLNLW